MKFLDGHLEDTPRSVRPSKQATVLQKVVDTVRTNRYGREKSCADIAGALSLEVFDISASTVWRVLKKAGSKKTKPTRRPGLTKRMKERYNWCYDYKDWTLEDWKNAIWSDETSIVLNHRGGGYRLWRKSNEGFVRSYIRERCSPSLYSRAASRVIRKGLVTTDCLKRSKRKRLLLVELKNLRKRLNLS